MTRSIVICKKNGSKCSESCNYRHGLLRVTDPRSDFVQSPDSTTVMRSHARRLDERAIRNPQSNHATAPPAECRRNASASVAKPPAHAMSQ